MSGISPAGRPIGPDLATDTQTDAPAPAAAPAAPAPATRIPGPGRPTIPMPSGTLPMPAQWGSAATLATDVEVLMDENAIDDLGAMVRTAVRSAAGPDGAKYGAAINETIESLARQNKLDTMLMQLQITAEDRYGLGTMGELRALLHQRGTEAAKRAFFENSMAAIYVTSTALLRDVAEAVNMGVDDLVGLHMSRLRNAYNNTYRQPTPEIKKLLDQTIQGLDKKGVLDDAIEAMTRETQQFIRDHPNVRYYPPEREIRDALARAASPETVAAWDRAAKRTADGGAEIAKRVQDALGRSGDREAAKLGQGLATIFDRAGGAQPDPERAKVLNEAIAGLARSGKLDDFIRACDRDEVAHWAAFGRRHPNVRIMRMPPVKDQIADAIQQVGTAETKAAWDKAVRATGKPTGHEYAADIAGALCGGEDNEVFMGADAVSTFVTRRYARAPTEEIAVLNQSVATLTRLGRLDDMVGALKRWDAAHPRTGPFRSYPGTFAQFDACVDRYGSAATKRAWANAIK